MSVLVPLPEGPVLDGFRPAVDPVSVGALVSRFLAEQRPVRALRPGYVRHKGADGSLVGWWVEVPGADDPVFITFRAASPWRLSAEAERLADWHARTPAGLKKLALLEREGLLLLSFPLDRVLRRLRHLVRTHRVGNLVSRQLDGVMPSGWRIDRATTLMRLVRYKPERRAVLRWDLGMRGPDGGDPRTAATYWRLHAAPLARGAYAALSQAHACGLPCPRPLGLLGDHLSVEGCLAGSPPELRSEKAPDQMRAAGRLVADLHGVAPPVDVPRHSPMAELDRAYQACGDIAGLRGDVGRLADRVVERMATTLPALSESVLLHGDLHPAQLLFTDGRAGLVDFDRSCAGPRALDLATFYAHLEAWDSTITEPLWDGFITGYGEARSLPDRAELAWFIACALLRQAVMPFRSLEPDWPSRMQFLVEVAARWMESV